MPWRRHATTASTSAVDICPGEGICHHRIDLGSRHIMRRFRFTAESNLLVDWLPVVNFGRNIQAQTFSVQWSLLSKENWLFGQKLFVTSDDIIWPLEHAIEVAGHCFTGTDIIVIPTQLHSSINSESFYTRNACRYKYNCEKLCFHDNRKTFTSFRCH